MDLLFGPVASHWTITVIPNYKQFLFAILPPGAFVFMGFLIALKNSIDRRLEERRRGLTPEVPKESRRVRVTGNI